MSVNVKQGLAFLPTLLWQSPHASAGGILCPLPCTVIWQALALMCSLCIPKLDTSCLFFVLFLLGHSSYVGAVFSTRGMQLFTFNCMELGEGDMRSPVGLCIGLVAVMRRAYLSTVLNDWNHAALRDCAQQTAAKATGCSCLLPSWGPCWKAGSVSMLPRRWTGQ